MHERSSAVEALEATMIIFGIDSKQQAKAAGQFHCPVCDQRRTYARLQQTRRFTLFFIPVVPLGSRQLGRVVCTQCGSEFDQSQVR
jgi:hypothetical protein